MNQPFMSPRYPGGPRPGVRMPQMPSDFNGPPGQPIMPNSMDPSRQGDGDFVGWQGPPGMSPRMTGPRGPGMGPGGPGGPVMSPGPGGPGGPGGMPPMSMGGPGPRQPWTPNTSTPISCASSPGSYGGMMGPPGSTGPPGPGTPIMPSPQGMNDTNSGGDGMYPGMMKPGVP